MLFSLVACGHHLEHLPFNNRLLGFPELFLSVAGVSSVFKGVSIVVCSKGCTACSCFCSDAVATSSAILVCCSCFHFIFPPSSQSSLALKDTRAGHSQR